MGDGDELWKMERWVKGKHTRGKSDAGVWASAAEGKSKREVRKLTAGRRKEQEQIIDLMAGSAAVRGFGALFVWFGVGLSVWRDDGNLTPAQKQAR